jgi:Uma2 family endonuclease
MATATLNPKMHRRGDEIDFPFELIDGVPTEKQPMGLFANILATYIATAINNFALPRKLGLAINETTYKINEENSRRPDVSYVEFSRLPPLSILGTDPPHLECSPNLAVKVVSPSNTFSEIERRLEDFFATGVQMVWVISPQTRFVYSFSSRTDCKILSETESLDGGTVLPGFSLPLAQLFGVIDPSN